MLGSLLDRIFVACSNRNGKLPSQIESHTFRNEDTNSNWVCFVPEFCYRVPFIRRRLIPEGIDMDIYILPKTAVQPNPELTHKFLDDILSTAIKKQNQFYLKKRVNVLGISLGNVLAFRFTEHFQVNKLISVVPGSRLAECIWEGIATNKIAQNSGRILRDYQTSLTDYNPIESVPRVNPAISEIYLGMRDLIIPFNRGDELAKTMLGRHKTNVQYNKYSGHVETIISFSKEFPKIVA